MTRRLVALASALFVAAAATGISTLSEGRHASPVALPVTGVTSPAIQAQTPSGATAPDRPARRGRTVARPVKLQIPAIGVDTALIPLGLDSSGALEVPGRFDVAGWWTGGARPGERGPAVIAGHVDSKTGPAVFFKLGQLHRGDAVVVQRGDGSSVRFTVEDTRHFSKTRFPSALVYGPTRGPALRLVTCSGTFDRSTGHYLDNTVVFASA
jgi:hypothetical protein